MTQTFILYSSGGVEFRVRSIYLLQCCQAEQEKTGFLALTVVEISCLLGEKAALIQKMRVIPEFAWMITH
jgi:hypothetical protein